MTTISGQLVGFIERFCIRKHFGWLVNKYRATFSNTFQTTHTRFTALGAGYLHVFASSSLRFIGLSASVVIGQGDKFGFGFTTLYIIVKPIQAKVIASGQLQQSKYSSTNQS